MNGVEDNTTTKAPMNGLKNHLDIFKEILQKRKTVKKSQQLSEDQKTDTIDIELEANQGEAVGNDEKTKLKKKKLKLEKQLKGRDAVHKVIKDQLKMIDYKVHYQENFENVIIHEKNQIEVIFSIFIKKRFIASNFQLRKPV